MLFLLDTRKFPVTLTPITVPKDCVLLRGYDSTFPELSDRPAFYSSSKAVSAAYGDKLGAFKATRPLRFLDLRYIRSILETLFTDREPDAMRCTLALAYGVCSLRTQLELFRTRYGTALRSEQDIQDRLASLETHLRRHKMPFFDAPGVRVAETTNDAEAVVYLKHIFESAGIDGYIAPDTKQEDIVLPAEIVLFTPTTCLEKIKTLKRVRRVTLDTLLRSDTNMLHLDRPIPFSFGKKGGSHKIKDAGAVLAAMSSDEYLALCDRANSASATISMTRVWDDKIIGRPTHHALQVSPWF